MRRFDAYESALCVLSTANQQDLTNEFVQGGIVDKFSLQFELGWKMLKELLRYEGDEMQRLLERILTPYIPCFEALADAVRQRYGDELAGIA